MYIKFKRNLKVIQLFLFVLIMHTSFLKVCDLINDVPRHFLLGGGAFHHLTNYCYNKKIVTGNTVANSLAVWLTFYQISCILDNIWGEAWRSHAPIATSMDLMVVFSECEVQVR